jgi:hypothetical protein
VIYFPCSTFVGQVGMGFGTKDETDRTLIHFVTAGYLVRFFFS